MELWLGAMGLTYSVFHMPLVKTRTKNMHGWLTKFMIKHSKLIFGQVPLTWFWDLIGLNPWWGLNTHFL